MLLLLCHGANTAAACAGERECCCQSSVCRTIFGHVSFCFWVRCLYATNIIHYLRAHQLHHTRCKWRTRQIRTIEFTREVHIWAALFLYHSIPHRNDSTLVGWGGTLNYTYRSRVRMCAFTRVHTRTPLWRPSVCGAYLCVRCAHIELSHARAEPPPPPPCKHTLNSQHPHTK